MILKKIVSLLLVLPILGMSSVYILALEPSFSVYPSSGTVRDSSEIFTIDVLIDSGEYSVTKAMFTLKFNPSQVRVTNAHRNNALFDQWPEDESTIDNTNGVIMLTGFTQSGGSKSLYKTVSQPDVMARLEFEVITTEKEDILFEFEYTGSDTLFTSVIMREGSPPQNVLNSKPQGARFSLVGYVIPKTSIDPSHMGVVAGIILIGMGIFISGSRVSFSKRSGTVVLYE